MELEFGVILEHLARLRDSRRNFREAFPTLESVKAIKVCWSNFLQSVCLQLWRPLSAVCLSVQIASISLI